MEVQEEEKEGAQEIKLKEKEKEKSKFKSKFIPILKLGQGMEMNGDLQEQLAIQELVGPRNFKALMKLGQGSFGVVYLVEKYTFDDNAGTATPDGRYFAMKILNKRQILG